MLYWVITNFMMVYKALCLNGGDRYPGSSGVIAQQSTVKNRSEVPYQRQRTHTNNVVKLKHLKFQESDQQLNWFENSWSSHIILDLVVRSQSLSPNRRLLSHSSRPLSHKSIKHKKYMIRTARNIQNFKNRPNSGKVMMILKNHHFF